VFENNATRAALQDTLVKETVIKATVNLFSASENV
jgi:hypothetical protein